MSISWSMIRNSGSWYWRVNVIHLLWSWTVWWGWDWQGCRQSVRLNVDFGFLPAKSHSHKPIFSSEGHSTSAVKSFCYWYTYLSRQDPNFKMSTSHTKRFSNSRDLSIALFQPAHNSISVSGTERLTNEQRRELPASASATTRLAISKGHKGTKSDQSLRLTLSAVDAVVDLFTSRSTLAVHAVTQLLAFENTTGAKRQREERSQVGFVKGII